MGEQLFVNLTYVLCNIIFYITMHMFFSCISSKIRNKTICIISYISCFMLGISIYLHSNQLPGYVVTFCSFTFSLIICVNYDKNLQKCLIFTTFLIILNKILELISGNVISIFLVNIYDGQLFNIFQISLSKLILLLISLICNALFKNTFKRPTIFWITTFLFTTGSIYTCYYLLFNSLKYNNINYLETLIILIILFSMNIIVFAFYNKICSDMALKEENARLSYYLKIQELQQQNIDNYYLKTAELNHDLNNYFLGIAQLIKDGKYNKALEIIEGKREQIGLLNNRICSPDNVLNNIINCKIDYAKSKEIAVNTTILLSNKLIIDAGDLSVLLGNALDNATEYLFEHQTDNKFIDVSIIYDHGILYIKISNPISEHINVPSNMIIPSSKKEGIHGIGINSMKKIVEKYNGTFIIDSIENIFSLEVTLLI